MHLLDQVNRDVFYGLRADHMKLKYIIFRYSISVPN